MYVCVCVYYVNRIRKPISRALFRRSGARLRTGAGPGNCRSRAVAIVVVNHAGGLSPTDQLSFRLH